MICFQDSDQYRAIILTVHRALWVSHLALLSRLATALQTSGSRALEVRMVRLLPATSILEVLPQHPLPKVYVS
jgi:hypothetical protein